MARLHRQLTSHPADSVVYLDDFIGPICGDIAESTGVFIRRRLDTITTNAFQAVQVGIILNEMVMNAMKHGNHESHAVTVTVTAELMYGNNFSLRITDNGVGLPDDFGWESAGGLGMSIITSAVDKIGGTIRVLESSCGAGFEIRVPQASNPPA